MRVLLSTFGTEGDVRPFVALARCLQDRGHEVAVSTADGFAGLVGDGGVPLVGFGNEWYDAMRMAMENAAGIPGILRQYPALLASLQAALDQQWSVARDVAPDVVVFHPKTLAAPHIAERLDVPALLAIPLPVFHPTASYPSAMVPGLPRPLWGVGYRLARGATAPYGGMLNRFRSRLGLPAVRRPGIDLVNPDGSPRHVLYAYSPSVVPVPPEYPATAHVTGYWFLEQPAVEPAPEVRAFVDAGRPDLYIGFGSMGMGGLRDRLSHAVAGALRRTGARAVVSIGWGGLDASRLPPNALGVQHVPHDWLFPRVRAVVHHGGSGTVAAGLSAGRPTLVCPLLGDQPFWGARLHDIGAGPEPLRMKKLTADRLAGRITTLLSHPDFASRAEEVGASIREEHGTAVAADIIEQIA